MKNIRRHLREIKELLAAPSAKVIEQVIKKVDLVYQKAEECKNTHFALRERCRQNEKEQVAYLRDVVSNLATKSDVIEAIENRANTGHSNVEGSTEIISKIAEKVDNLSEVVTSVANAPPPPPQETQPAQPQRPLFSDIAKRTFVLKPIHRNLPAGQVQKDLNAAGVALPVAIVERVRPTRNAMEIVCKDTASMEIAKRSLQQNQKLNRDYNCVAKTVSKQKIIVLAVPSHLDKSYVHHTIVQTFHLKEDTISVLTSLKSRSPNHNNWVILADEVTAKYLVHSNGANFSHKYCLIRPHTSLPRCLKCQRLGHLAARCTQAQACSTCSRNHTITENNTCDSRPTCINCWQSNQDRDTQYNYHHRPSSSECESYRAAYTRERARINRIFGWFAEPPQPQAEQTEQRGHRHQRSPSRNTRREESPRPRRRPVGLAPPSTSSGRHSHSRSA